MEGKMQGTGKSTGPDHEMIGARLKSLRKGQGYTAQQVADYLGIDQSHYSRIENGKRRLRWLSHLEKLCVLYDCSHEYILCESDDYEPQEWVGIDGGIDLNIIAQVNLTSRHLKVLRNVQELEDIRKLNDDYIDMMDLFKQEYMEGW